MLKAVLLGPKQIHKSLQGISLLYFYWWNIHFTVNFIYLPRVVKLGVKSHLPVSQLSRSVLTEESRSNCWVFSSFRLVSEKQLTVNSKYLTLYSWQTETTTPWFRQFCGIRLQWRRWTEGLKGNCSGHGTLVTLWKPELSSTFLQLYHLSNWGEKNHLTSVSPGKYINQVILDLTCGTQVREHCFHDYLLQRGPECAPLLASMTSSVLKR